MYDVSHKKEKLSMCMYDVIVKKAKIMRQKHKNMFESAVLIVKRAKTRANARAAHGAHGGRGARGSRSQAKRPTLTSTRISYLLENLIYIYGYRYRE